MAGREIYFDNLRSTHAIILQFDQVEEGIGFKEIPPKDKNSREKGFTLN